MKRKLIIVAALAAFTAGCETVDTTKAGAVGVERHQRMAVSAEEVNAGAQKAYAQMMAEAQKKGALDRDAAQVARVKNIVSKLVPQTAVFRDDATKWPWEVHVISIDEVNAWCMPAGKMAIYTGLINKLGATDDEIAAVMGHEIAHALREHSREQMSQQALTQAGIGIASALFGVGDLGQNVAGMVADVTLLKPKSRGMETESDRIGIELAARAGYNPQAAVTLWQKMEKLAGSQPPKWLSTHPPHGDRIADLQNYAQKVMPLYAAAKGGSAAVGGTK
jgi:predicted Zn-dependent protease